ncbi:MAG: hypothetical protein AAF533_11715 [Acidobacteriota bacterium]
MAAKEEAAKGVAPGGGADPDFIRSEVRTLWSSHCLGQSVTSGRHGTDMNGAFCWWVEVSASRPDLLAAVKASQGRDREDPWTTVRRWLLGSTSDTRRRR